MRKTKQNREISTIFIKLFKKNHLVFKVIYVLCIGRVLMLDCYR